MLRPAAGRLIAGEHREWQGCEGSQDVPLRFCSPRV